MNILIADDEPLIHVSIQYTIQALNRPDVTVFNAANGREMLAEMQRAPVDLALVDIRMPGMSGLEAIQQAKAHWPDTDYYIMSGYSEFEYARQAVHLGVAEYLLKPLPPEQIAALIRKAEEKQRRRAFEARSRFAAWLATRRAGQPADELYPEGYYAVVLLVTCDAPGARPQDWLTGMVGLGPDHFSVVESPGGALGFLYAPTAQFCLEVLQKLPAGGYPALCTLFVSSLCCTAAHLDRAVQSVRNICALRVFHGTGRRYDVSDTGRVSWQELEEAKAWLAVYSCLLHKNVGDFAASSRFLLQTLHYPLPAGQRQAVGTFFRALRPGWPDPAPDRPALTVQLRELGEQLGQPAGPTDKLDAILGYLQQNFAQDISVASLSERFGLTPNYLSTLFKKRLGVKFTEYLTGLRLDEAKKLLRTTRRPARQIAGEVGYYSQSYFTKLFIDKVGCTPAEYRASGAPGTET